MVAGMASQGGVIALHIQLELAGQAILVEEAHRCGNIPVVLVLGGLLHRHVMTSRLSGQTSILRQPGNLPRRTADRPPTELPVGEPGFGLQPSDMKA